MPAYCSFDISSSSLMNTWVLLGFTQVIMPKVASVIIPSVRPETSCVKEMLKLRMLNLNRHVHFADDWILHRKQTIYGFVTLRLSMCACRCIIGHSFQAFDNCKSSLIPDNETTVILQKSRSTIQRVLWLKCHHISAAA